MQIVTQYVSVPLHRLLQRRMLLWNGYGPSHLFCLLAFMEETWWCLTLMTSQGILSKQTCSLPLQMNRWLLAVNGKFHHCTVVTLPWISTTYKLQQASWCNTSNTKFDTKYSCNSVTQDVWIAGLQAVGQDLRRCPCHNVQPRHRKVWWQLCW